MAVRSRSWEIPMRRAQLQVLRIHGSPKTRGQYMVFGLLGYALPLRAAIMP